MIEYDYDETGHTGHHNDMTVWPEIKCQEGHESHATRPVLVDLAKPHGYHDLPLIPERFHRQFTMHIYDHRQYRKATSYCPGHDAVSETIESHGIWEPCETILTLAALTSHPREPREYVADFGAQIGWFSMLAASERFLTLAYDADEENLTAVEESSRANGGPPHGWEEWVVPLGGRIGPELVPRQRSGERFRFVKIDVEGAERDVLRYMWAFIEAGEVEHLLVEISPVFADYYPDLVCDLLDVGYRAWQVPEKSRDPRPVLDDIEADLAPWRLDGKPRDELRAWVAGLHQINAWFSLPGAEFG